MRVFQVLGLFLTLLAVSCGSIVRVVEDVPPYTNTTGKPIYPAVLFAVASSTENEFWTNFKESTHTIVGSNNIILDNVICSDILKLANFRLRIFLKDNVVTYEFSNIRTRSVGETTWEPQQRFMQTGNELMFKSYFNSRIPLIMEDEELYNELKADMDKNLGLSF